MMDEEQFRIAVSRVRRVQGRLSQAVPWVMEAAGVAAISAGGWIAWEPLGLFCAGGYAVLVANQRRNGDRR